MAGAATPGGNQAFAPLPFRRLTRVEYVNTVASLLGTGIAVSVDLPTDATGASTYPFPSDVGNVERDRFEQAARLLAADPKVKVADLSPCPKGLSERGCAVEWIRTFGKRAFRRPLLDDESTRLIELYDAVRKDPVTLSHVEALGVLLQAVLQSPQFLYRWELGPIAPVKSGALVKLGPWELASRLSYFLTATMPDESLFRAAEAGKLDTIAGLESETRRLLGEKGAVAAGQIFGHWLALPKLQTLVKDKAVIADFPEDLRAAMRAESERFIERVVMKDGNWSALLTSREGEINGPLAKLYGVSGVTGSAFVPRTYEATRAGLFTRSAFLAIKALPQESSPVHRGKIVVERLLCRTIPPPPPNINADPPPISDKVQTREAYERHSTDPACSGCHALMDPLGFAFEGFDAIGRSRVNEKGMPVNTSGKIPFLDGQDVAFTNAADMMERLVKSKEARSCVVEQWMRFALGRAVVPADGPARSAIEAAFEKSGFNLRDLAVAIVSSEAFRFRAPSAGEVLP